MLLWSELLLWEESLELWCGECLWSKELLWDWSWSWLWDELLLWLRLWGSWLWNKFLLWSSESLWLWFGTWVSADVFKWALDGFWDWWRGWDSIASSTVTECISNIWQLNDSTFRRIPCCCSLCALSSYTGFLLSNTIASFKTIWVWTISSVWLLSKKFWIQLFAVNFNFFFKSISFKFKNKSDFLNRKSSKNVNIRFWSYEFQLEHLVDLLRWQQQLKQWKRTEKPIQFLINTPGYITAPNQNTLQFNVEQDSYFHNIFSSWI